MSRRRRVTTGAAESDTTASPDTDGGPTAATAVRSGASSRLRALAASAVAGAEAEEEEEALLPLPPPAKRARRAQEPGPSRVVRELSASAQAPPALREVTAATGEAAEEALALVARFDDLAVLHVSRTSEDGCTTFNCSCASAASTALLCRHSWALPHALLSSPSYACASLSLADAVFLAAAQPSGLLAAKGVAAELRRSSSEEAAAAAAAPPAQRLRDAVQLGLLDELGEYDVVQFAGGPCCPIWPRSISRWRACATPRLSTRSTRARRS
mmetsp:Transcript_17757/g.58101  ORF Transcript_17757/g.58101 Transcript_17757/m.58101 type:complete len:271 (+) Transcript_17757:51-863(+)